MRRSASDLGSRAVGVRFDAARLHVVLDDGRDISVPLARFPRLRDASASERADWRLIGRGQGVHWASVDEDISVAGLLPSH